MKSEVEPLFERGNSTDRRPELPAVVELARTVMSDDAATRWLHSPNPDLGHESPLDLVAAGNTQRVVALLLALAEGVTT